MRSPRSRGRGLRLLLLVGTATLASNVFAAWFVAQERFIYYWDLAGYWLKFRAMGDAIRDAPLDGLLGVIRSVRIDDYNLLPVLPLLPFEWLFGGSRLSYVLAITNLALLPSALILGLGVSRWAAEPSERPPLSSLLLASACVLAQASLWVAALRGLPDVIGIGTIGLLLLIQFRTPLSEQGPAQVVATGGLLCLLTLERRWYAYWVAGLFAGLAIATVWDIHARHGLSWSRLARALVRGAGIVLVFLAGVFSLATPVALRSVRTDYADIHSAYRFSGSLLETVGTLSAYFGWGVIILAGFGLARLVYTQRTLTIGVALSVQAVVVLLMFARTQDFDVHHFYLLFPAIAIGLSSLVVSVWQSDVSRTWRVGLVSAVMLFSLLNSASVFLPGAAGVGRALGGLVPRTRHYPLIRTDLGVVERILSALETAQAQHRGPVYVVASSDTMNSHIVDVACRVNAPARSFCDEILVSSDVDKRDGFPRTFPRASYVLVASPAQYHLRSEDQRVVGMLARDMANAEGIGGAFTRLPYEFKLDHNVVVHVYGKIRPIGQQRLDALSAELAGHYPSMRDMFLAGTAGEEGSSVITPESAFPPLRQDRPSGSRPTN